jgi:8-oxo-dGTP pyrophosphatase MutT (NUDIX family)
MSDDTANQRDPHTDPSGVSRSPWVTISSLEVYRNPWLHVIEYTVRRPDGNPGIYGVVYPGDNAAIVALDAQDHVYLVGEFNFPLQRFEWMIPSGKVEDGEDPLAAARRELAEEVGMAASLWEPLGDYYLSSGISPQTTHVFLATNLSAGHPEPEATERFKIERRPLESVFDSCLRNEIRDAPTVLGIWRAWLQRAGRI